MLTNAIRAARLDVDFYNTVENDASFTQQAGMLVALVGLLTGLGNSFVLKGFFLPIIWGVIGALIGWVVWSFITDFVGRTFFGGESDLGQMMRVLGYAQAPLALGIIPFLSFIGVVWALVAAVVAIREGQDFTTGKAIGTVIIGWIAYAVAMSIVYAIF
jgi:hypothetical protein